MYGCIFAPHACQVVLRFNYHTKQPNNLLSRRCDLGVFTIVRPHLTDVGMVGKVTQRRREEQMFCDALVRYRRSP